MCKYVTHLGTETYIILSNIKAILILSEKEENQRNLASVNCIPDHCKDDLQANLGYFGEFMTKRGILKTYVSF